MNNGGMFQTRPGEWVSSVVARFYTWAVAISFGAVIIDIMYSRLVPDAEAAFSEVADFLLLLYAVTLLGAIAAIGLSWHLNIARNFFIVSLVIICVGFLIPVFFSLLFRDAHNPALGTWIRIAVSGLPSILAFIGLGQFYRQRTMPH